MGNLLVQVRDGRLTGEEVKVIDLDRSIPGRSVSRKARISNLARLLRHAVKNNLQNRKDWSECWRALLQGYCGKDEDPGRLVREVEGLLRRSLFFHRWSWRIQGR
jgi:hypothetical protein